MFITSYRFVNSKENVLPTKVSKLVQHKTKLVNTTENRKTHKLFKVPGNLICYQKFSQLGELSKI